MAIADVRMLQHLLDLSALRRCWLYVHPRSARWLQATTRIDGWNAAHPNADDYSILETAVRNRGAFCPFLTKECVEPEVARDSAAWVKGPSNTCCQGNDHSCCSSRVLRKVPEQPVSRAEWYVHPTSVCTRVAHRQSERAWNSRPATSNCHRLRGTG